MEFTHSRQFLRDIHAAAILQNWNVAFSCIPWIAAIFWNAKVNDPHPQPAAPGLLSKATDNWRSLPLTVNQAWPTRAPRSRQLLTDAAAAAEVPYLSVAAAGGSFRVLSSSAAPRDFGPLTLDPPGQVGKLLGCESLQGLTRAPRS